MTGAQTHNYAYDAVGNRITADGTSYVKNTLNQYTQVGPTALIYTTNGNLANDGPNGYTYDEENRLIGVTKGTTNASYTYDAFNRRVSKTVNGVTKYFVYDRDDIIAEYDPAGVLLAEYVHGNSTDEVLTMTRNGATYYYNHDGLGSVTEITDGTGAVVENYTYDVYGQPSVTNSLIGNPYRFTGREYDEESGVYHYRARAYSPIIGRFLQRDPIGYYDSMNLYQYVGNNPANMSDPLGLSSVLLGRPWGVFRFPPRFGTPRPPANYPKPKEWTKDWQWRYPEPSSPKDSPRWFDPNGGEWRWHAPDKYHPKGHWDYNPWEQWNSPWQNVEPGLVPPIPGGPTEPDSDSDCGPEPPSDDWDECFASGLCL